jgi:hypothetical protein
MKRLGSCALALILGLALVAPAATAAIKSYSGTVSPSGTVNFKVKTTQHNGHKVRTVPSFHFRAIPVTCADGAHTTDGNVTFPVKLNKQRKFNISATNSNGASLHIHGAVAGKTATGTLQVSGDIPIETGSTGSNCASGTLSWTV